VHSLLVVECESGVSCIDEEERKAVGAARLENVSCEAIVVVADAIPVAFVDVSVVVLLAVVVTAGNEDATAAMAFVPQLASRCSACRNLL
jgi:hypothetical protein